MELGQLVDDISQIGQDELRLRVRRVTSGGPSRNGGLRDLGDVRDVDAFEAAAFLKILNRFCNRGIHETFLDLLGNIIVSHQNFKKPFCNMASVDLLIFQDLF
jgi:hypothetical protein